MDIYVSVLLNFWKKKWSFIFNFFFIMYIQRSEIANANSLWLRALDQTAALQSCEGGCWNFFSFHHCRQSNLPQKTMQMNRILLRKLFKALHGTKISFTLVNCIINNESNWGADLQKSGHVMWFSNKYQLLNRFIERKKTNNLNLYIQRICYYFRLYI